MRLQCAALLVQLGLAVVAAGLGASSCQQGTAFSLRKVGEPCQSSGQCVSGFCQAGSCQPLANGYAGRVCASDAQCGGLICDPVVHRCVACPDGSARCGVPDGGAADGGTPDRPQGIDGPADRPQPRDAAEDGEDVSVSDRVGDRRPNDREPDGLSGDAIVGDVFVSDAPIACSPQDPCPAGQCCQSLCRDTLHDPAACGGCDQACGGGQSCHGGVCCTNMVTATGTACCADQLQGTDGNPCCFSNLGDICFVMQTGVYCDVRGPDQVFCGTLCGNRVVDLKTDPQNCGSCGCACPMGASCGGSDGQCALQQGGSVACVPVH